MSDTGKIIALAKALGARPDPDDVKQNVEDWLDDHPEATTTVQDGSITKAKLDSNLKGTVDDVDELKSALGYCDIKTIAGSKNIWNPATMKDGYVGTNGAWAGSSSYVYNTIDVQAGDIVYCSVAGNVRYMRFICAYNANDEAVSASGSGSDINGFTVPNGIVKLAISVVSSIKDNVMIILNDDTVPVAKIPYVAQSERYVATDEFLQDVDVLTSATFENEYMEDVPKNILNPSESETGKLVIYNSGALVDNSSYYTTGYMPVKAGATYYFWSKTLGRKGGRAIAAFDSSKTNVSAAGINDGNSSIDNFVVPQGVAYIRVSFAYRNDDITFQPSGNMVIASATPSEFMAYDSTEEHAFKAEYMPDIKPNLHVYLPPEICVGIGRTIELYNDLVCLEADKYHLYYICAKGVQYERKFSITGETAGSYPLTLQIYDDDLHMIWTGTSTVKVVANSISSQLKVLPIGDSLTNLKPWLAEVQTLANDKILYIGTRGRTDQTIRCEGRSGFTAANYNANTPYTFDDNYVGADGVSGSVNPFWNGTRFSLDYYNTQQASTVGNADAIELLLGTNDVFSGLYTAEECAEHITDIIDNIRLDDASIPIFVCNTIYRSNQNGYYSSGGQGFAAASGWAFDSDMRIMAFQKALAAAIEEKEYTAVYIVPCSVCMDRDNDFGQVDAPVNPRLTDVTVKIPAESVHPQDAGYNQMADVMYSSFVAHLT